MRTIKILKNSKIIFYIFLRAAEFKRIWMLQHPQTIKCIKQMFIPNVSSFFMRPACTCLSSKNYHLTYLFSMFGLKKKQFYHIKMAIHSEQISHFSLSTISFIESRLDLPYTLSNITQPHLGIYAPKVQDSSSMSQQ